MSFGSATGLTATQLVEQLADPHRYHPALQRLLELGPDAAGPARDGLTHPDPGVRSRCCKVLDHVMDAASTPALVAALDDPVAVVRIDALHALACDRCKNDSGCRPDAAAVLPPGIRILRTDSDPHVRAMAAELVGAWVHRHDEAVRALEATAAHDPSPAVRKKARWYLPGGAVYRRTQPHHGETTGPTGLR
jgi:hypothetical protein